MAALGVPTRCAVAAGTADLGVDGLEEGLLPKVLLCAHEGLPDGRLATASRAQQEDRPAHHKDLTQLADLEAEGLVCLVAQLQSCLLDLHSRVVFSMMKMQLLKTKLFSPNDCTKAPLLPGANSCIASYQTQSNARQAQKVKQACLLIREMIAE